MGRRSAVAAESGAWGEGWVPAVKVVGEVVEGSGTDPKEQVGTVCGPTHLLFWTMHLLITWFTADSVNSGRDGSLARSRWRVGSVVLPVSSALRFHRTVSRALVALVAGTERLWASIARDRCARRDGPGFVAGNAGFPATNPTAA
jgi:hypothetical protein